MVESNDESLKKTRREEQKFIHDIATPLAVIGGHLKLLSLSFEDPDATPTSQEKIRKNLRVSLEQMERVSLLLEERRRALNGLSRADS